MANAPIKFTGDTADAKKAIEKLQAQFERLEAKIKSTTRASRRGSKQATQGLRDQGKATQGLSKKLAGIATAYLGIQAATKLATIAVRALITEHRELTSRQRIAAATKITAAEAVRRTTIAFTPDPTLTKEQLVPTIQRIAKETRTDFNIVAAAFTDAFSAKGQLANIVAVRAVKQSLRLLPGDVESATALAGRFLDLGKATGKTDIRAIGGFVQNVQAASRVTSLEKIGTQGVPAILSLIKLGDSAEEAAELFAAVTQLMGDAEGRLAKTATINLAGRLKDFVVPPPAVIADIKDRQKRKAAEDRATRGVVAAKDARGTFEIPKEQIKRFEDAETTQQRIAVLQQNAELRRLFVSKVKFDAASNATIQSLLRGDPIAVAELRTTQRLIKPIGPGQAKLFEKKIADLEAGEFQGGLTLAQRTAVSVQQSELRDPTARAGQVREDLNKILEKINFTAQIDFVARSAARLIFEERIGAREAPGRAAAGILQAIIEDPNKRFFGKRGPSAEEVRLLSEQRDSFLEFFKFNQRRDAQSPAGMRAAIAAASRAALAGGTGPPTPDRSNEVRKRGQGMFSIPPSRLPERLQDMQGPSAAERRTPARPGFERPRAVPRVGQTVDEGVVVRTPLVQPNVGVGVVDETLKRQEVLLQENNQKLDTQNKKLDEQTEAIRENTAILKQAGRNGMANNARSGQGERGR